MTEPRVSDEELQHSVNWQGSMDKTVLLHDAPYIRRLSADLIDARTELTSLRALVREMYDEWMPDFWEQAPTPRQSLLHKRAAALGCLAEAPDDHQ